MKSWSRMNLDLVIPDSPEFPSRRALEELIDQTPITVDIDGRNPVPISEPLVAGG